MRGDATGTTVGEGADRLTALFQCLADPTRRAVIDRLTAGPASVSDLAQPFDMALPSFVKHIRFLESRGIVVTEKAGRVRTCRLDGAALGPAQDWLNRQRRSWQAQADRLAAFVERSDD